MNLWWRAYNEAVDDPKLQRLPNELFKTWFNVMCLASANNGTLPPLADIAFKLRLSESKAEKALNALNAVGLLDVADGKLQPHNWNGRQFVSDVSTERVQRFRERKRNVSLAVTETPPDTEADTDTEAEAERKKGKGPTRKRAATTPKVELPENWLPSEDLTAAENGELERMRDWARANAIRRADWLATWRNWKRRALEFQQQRARTNGHHRKQSGTELAYELAAEVRKREHSAGIRRSDDPVGSH